MTSERPLPATPLGDLALTPALAAALVRSIGDGLYVVDRHGRLVVINPVGEALLGHREADLQGRDVHEAFHAHVGRDACRLLAVLESRQSVHVASDTFRRADGSTVEVECTSSPILQDDELLGAVVVFRDVTAEREAQRRADRLAAEQRALGEDLQRGLLPVGLGAIPGAEHAVAFRPAGRGVLVGGDFYDVFPTARGHVVVVGDVQGKGPQAAAVAAMVRFLLRGACVGQEAELGRALALVDGQLLGHPSERWCTVAAVHVRAVEDGLEAEAVAAGHPSPVLLRADGEAAEVGGRGRALGLWPGFEVRPERVALAPGDALVLFSDGLTDAGRPAGRPPLDVRAALAGRRGLGAEGLVRHLERCAGLTDAQEPPDDVAVLALRACPPRPTAR